MIKVTVPEDLIPAELGIALSPAVVQEVLTDVMASARHHWVTEAGKRLHATAGDYVGGLQEVVVEGTTATLALTGAFPVMLEEGAPAYDMHDTLLGPNVPVAGPGGRGKHPRKGGGFYRSVPFRHQTPGTLGVAGAPMGNQYGRGLPDAGTTQSALGKAVHAAARRLAPTTGMPGGGTKWGGRLPDGVGGAGLLKPHHTTDIYAGMVRQQKTYGRATQNTYTTFRTISDGKMGGWIHPGITGVHILDSVVQHVEDIAGRAFVAAAGVGS